MNQKILAISLSILCILFFASSLKAQVPGDTIKVRTFHYGSNTRDTLAKFPTGNLSYEKIIMKYNMRCKNGLVSNSTDRNLGCGEWDYSCNTYIVDSNKVEEVLSLQPNYTITNFTGTSFPYTALPVYDYYQYTQQKITLDSTSADTTYTLQSGTNNYTQLLNTNQHSGKTQFIYTAAELMAAGLTAGPINSISLQANNNATANFLKVKIKHTTSDNFANGKAELNNLTQVKWTGYATTINGNALATYDMDVSGGNVRILTTPLANAEIQHFIASSVSYIDVTDISLLLELDGFVANSIMSTESNINITTE